MEVIIVNKQGVLISNRGELGLEGDNSFTPPKSSQTKDEEWARNESSGSKNNTPHPSSKRGLRTLITRYQLYRLEL